MLIRYLFRWVAIGRNYGTARVVGSVYLWEETESTCFRLVNKVIFSYRLYDPHRAFH